MSINTTILTGRLTKDVELRKTTSGVSVASFTLAVNRIGAKEGQPQADFISCVCFNKVAENVAQYCGKGSQVGIKGKIQTRNYENQQGQKIYVTEIVCEQIEFLGSKNQSNTQYQQPYQQSYQPQYNDEPYTNTSSLDIDTDDLPFY